MNYSRKIFSYIMHLDAAPEKVFPLLCPVKEYQWIEHWKCEIIYSLSGYAEKDCIFRTNFSGEGEDIWVTSRYEPDNLIEFVRVDGSRTIRYKITLKEIESGKTESEWSQVVTAINEKGNLIVQELTEEEFISEKKALEKLLNHFLSTGKMLVMKGI